MAQVASIVCTTGSLMPKHAFMILSRPMMRTRTRRQGREKSRILQMGRARQMSIELLLPMSPRCENLACMWRQDTFLPGRSRLWLECQSLIMLSMVCRALCVQR